MNKLSIREDFPNPKNNKSSHLGPVNLPWILLVALCLAITLIQPAEAVQFTYGTYVGNGVDGRSITGVGFQPDAVIIKSSSGNYAVMRTTTMAGDATKQLAVGNGLQTNRIQSLGADGFTVGNNGEVNSSGTTYYWMAYKDTGEGDFKVGSYTGNGLDNRSITGVGFQPDYLIVMPAAGQKAVQRSSAMVGDKSLQFDGSASAANLVQALETDGFQVGNDNQVNSNGTAYHYVAWKAITGKTKVGSYVGNGLDNRSIAGIGFKPEYVIVKGDSGAVGVHRSASITGDSTLRFPASGIISNSIQDLQSDSFQVGTDSTANANGTTYYWVAFNAVSEASKLAIASVNGGTNPTAGLPFSVVVESQDTNGVVTPVNAATGIALSLKTGTGTLGGTLTGTITAGTSQVTISGVTYTKAESGVVLTATRTSGDVLIAGDSAPFTVNPGAASSLTFSTQPGNTTAESPIPGPPTITVFDGFGNVVTSSTASITIAIGTNPGNGTLSGTTTKNASVGVASFGDLSINQGGTGYTFTASSSGLSGATSSAFNITALVPDLIVSNVSNPPASAVAGGSFNVTDTTANNGTTSAAASTTSYRLSLDNVITGSDPLLTGSRSVPSLSAGTNSSGTISVTIPSSLAAGTYFLGACADETNVVAESNETNNCVASATTVSVSAPPSITNLSPASGPIGTSVTVAGSNFGATQGSNTVTFNGTAATPTSWSDTSVSVPVPAGAATGPVIVTVNNVASNGVTFSVTMPVSYIYDALGRLRSVIDSGGDAAIYNYDAVGNLLSITHQSSSALSLVEFAPSSGPVGTTVTIYGTGFSTTAGENAVVFNGTTATVTTAAATQIVVTVPSGATTGLISVTTPAGSVTSSSAFTVTGSTGTPTITSFTPVIGTPGTAVTISGTNFQTTAASESVIFNITRGIIGSTSPTSIATTVPIAGSGRISVITPQGKATSTADFFIPPPGFTAADVQFTGRMVLGGSKTVTISTPNKIGLVVFDATAGQRVSLLVNSSTFPNCSFATLRMIRADGTPVDGFPGFTRGCNGSFLDVLTMPVTGSYSVSVDPSGTDTGSLTFTLFSVPPDISGAITPGGPSTTVNLNTPGQKAKLSFSGTQGQRVSLSSNGTTCATVSIFKPDGVVLVSAAGACSNAFIDAQTLPVTGTYSVLVDPDLSNIGSFTLTLYTFADITGTITPGGAAQTVNITTPGQNASLIFNGTIGQRVSLSVTSSSFGCSSGSLRILKPDGSTLASASPCADFFSGFIDAQTLPVTGTYTVFIDPSLANTGNITVRLYDVPPDITGTITPSGSSVTVNLTTPGQNARLTFDGISQQRVSIFFSGTTCGHVSIVKPDGVTLATGFNGSCTTGFLDTQTLPVTGTYTVLVDPDKSNTGSFTLTLYNVVNFVGNITPGGPSVSFNIDTPGQNASLFFTGTINQRISWRINSSTITNGCSSGQRWIFKPDGTNLVPVAGTICTGGFIDATTLPVNGTYQLFIDPADSATGSITTTLYDVPADFSGSTTINGPSVTVPITTPGQNGNLTFGVASTQQVTVRLTANSITGSSGCVIVRLLNPSNTEIALASGCGSFNLPSQTLTTVGTYTVKVDPVGFSTGNLTVSVTSP